MGGRIHRRSDGRGSYGGSHGEKGTEDSAGRVG